MSRCSANGAFATCFNRTKDFTMPLVRAYRWTKMHQRCVLFRPLAASWPIRTSEVCAINTFDFDFR
jgi:hypothetical protein